MDESSRPRRRRKSCPSGRVWLQCAWCCEYLSVLADEVPAGGQAASKDGGPIQPGPGGSSGLGATQRKTPGLWARGFVNWPIERRRSEAVVHAEANEVGFISAGDVDETARGRGAGRFSEIDV